jgi:archaellum component FlaC
MKKLLYALLALIVLVIVVAIIIFVRLDYIIKRTVETQATDSLNLTTTLDSAHLAVFGGQLTLKDLAIACPQGYTVSPMLGLNKASVVVRYGQLGKDPIHIQTIAIDGPKLVIEQKGNDVNFKAMMDQQPKKAPPPTPPSGGDRPKDQPIRVVIERVDVTNASVVIRPGLPGLDKEITIPIPSITLRNIGNSDGADNGAAIKDAVMQVVTALANKASDSGAITDALRNALKDNVREVAGKLTKDFQKQIGDVTNQLGNVTNQLNKVTDQLPPEIKQQIPGDLNKQINAATQKVKTGDLDKAVDKGLNDLLGGGKKKKKDKDSQ